MDTLLITITRGSITSNLLKNDFYRILREKYKLVILTPAYQDERFLQEFLHPNVRFLPFPDLELTRYEQVLFFLHKHLIYNSTVNQKVRWGIIGDPKSRHSTYVGYLFKRTIFTVLSHIHPLRDFVRWVDVLTTQKKEVFEYAEMLREISPLCVISTNITSDNEVALIKASKMCNIPSVGFLKSWDNLSKHGFRAKPDHLVVWNTFMKEQAVKFHNYKPEGVTAVGVPQYDANEDVARRMSRVDFCALYGLDPAQKIILFGSEGKLFPSDTVIADLLAKIVTDTAFPIKTQLLIRPHYGYKKDEKKFASLKGVSGVVIDTHNNPSKEFRDLWDYSAEFSRRFTNSMYHADIVINTASTLTLDAICFDTPVINIAFNGKEALPYSETVERWYETYYFKRIMTYGATTLVRTPAELRAAILQYLKHPETNRSERMRLRDDFTFMYNGGAGKRFADFVTGFIEKK